jgi:hypothetical protein
MQPINRLHAPVDILLLLELHVRQVRFVQTAPSRVDGIGSNLLIITSIAWLSVTDRVLVDDGTNCSTYSSRPAMRLEREIVQSEKDYRIVVLLFRYSRCGVLSAATDRDCTYTV